MKCKHTSDNFQIRKSIILWICGFFPMICCAQTDIREYIQLDTVLSFPSEEIIGDQSPICCSFANHLIFTNYSTYKHSDSIYVYKINLISKDIDTIILYEKGLSAYLEEEQCHGFDFIAYNESYLVLALSKQLFIYSLQHGQYVSDKKIMLPHSYAKRVQFISDGKLLLADAYYPRRPQTAIAIYDIVEEKFTHQIHPFFNHILSTFIQSTNLMDVSDGLILSAHRNEYAFILYDSLLKQTDSISWNTSNWIGFPQNLEKRIYKKYNIHDAADIIYEMRPFYWKIDQITGLRFLNQNKIMIDYRIHEANNPQKTSFVDVWEKTNGKWTMKYEQLRDGFVGLYTYNKDSLTNKSFSIGFISGNKMTVAGDKLAVLQLMGTDFNPIGLSKNDFIRKEETYFETHNACVQFYIYSHHF